MQTENLEPLLMQRIVGVGYVNGVLLICTPGRDWYFRVDGDEIEIEVEDNSWFPSLTLQ